MHEYSNLYSNFILNTWQLCFNKIFSNSYYYLIQSDIILNNLFLTIRLKSFVYSLRLNDFFMMIFDARQKQGISLTKCHFISSIKRTRQSFSNFIQKCVLIM